MIKGSSRGNSVGSLYHSAGGFRDCSYWSTVFVLGLHNSFLAEGTITCQKISVNDSTYVMKGKSMVYGRVSKISNLKSTVVKHVKSIQERAQKKARDDKPYLSRTALRHFIIELVAGKRPREAGCMRTESARRGAVDGRTRTEATAPWRAIYFPGPLGRSVEGREGGTAAQCHRGSRGQNRCTLNKKA